MRHIFLLLSLAALPCTGQTTEPVTAAATTAAPASQSAPAFRFATIDYEAALRSLPEYQAATAKIEELRTKYKEEAKRSEDDFNAKYEEFLEQQKDYPPSIRRKRQNELQAIMADNIAFRDESRRLIDEARAEAMRPAGERLAAIIAAIARERRYSFVLNTAQNACPYINPAEGEDITEEVKTRAASRKR